MRTNFKAVARSISFSFRNTTNWCAMLLLLRPHGVRGWCIGDLDFRQFEFYRDAHSEWWQFILEDFVVRLRVPGTLLTLMVVEAGSERAYGIDMPRKQSR